MMTVRVAGQAAPKGGQRDGAGAADRQGGAGSPELGEVLTEPAGRHCGGFLVEAGQARDVAGDDADREEVHGDLLAVRSGWCHRSWQLWARLPADTVSGRRIIDVIARLRGGR
jgi:hypothetical protein